MSNDAMNVDHDQPHTKAQALQTLISGPISSSISNLSASSRCIPSERDFHFYRNFNEFKHPVNEIVKESQLMLESIGVSIAKESVFPVDIDDAYDWLVNLNDDVLERFDLSTDEFRKVRMEEEETGRPVVNPGMEDDGFQLVSGKKKKGGRNLESSDETVMEMDTAVKVAMKDKKTMGPKAKVPFHVPTIRRPQDEYTIVVDNANIPFEHAWLEKSDDGQRVIHPLEKLSVLDFVDKDPENVVPVKPSPLESTPFMFVEDVKSLKELADKLHSADEFAVDLEHNQYRSFQGLTCLMQISTRTEDFVVDTLKLRVHVGPYLREVFKDPSKRKVMHGADRDIVWLQRDFGIYICNLFDTGQASKVLKLERNSLEYLLRHFCEVTANKEYQNADWRVRPIPDVMLRYAREDTHYLMYVYDLMRIKLFALSKESESVENPLVEVYKRSYDVCMQLYEKELLTEKSYLHIYGLQGAGFSSQQLAIVSGLCEWRDIVARSTDESTGYVLPNKAVLEIAKQMPVTTSKLRRLVKSKHPFVERNLDTVLNIIKHSIQNAAAFEEAAQQLKDRNASTESSQHQDTNVLLKIKPPSVTSELPRASLTIPEQNRDANVDALPKAKENGASVQVLKKPTGAFGALLGKSASKRKFYPETKEKEENKLEQIRSSVSLPFHSFLGSHQEPNPVVESPNLTLETSNPQKPDPVPYPTSTLDEIIMLESDAATEDKEQNNNLENSNDQREKNYNVSPPGKEDESEPMSLSELSSNFQTRIQSNNQNNETPLPKNAEQVSATLQVKPFDYEEALKHAQFGENKKRASSKKDGKKGQDDSGNASKKKRLTKGQEQTDDSTKELQQGRRRLAFPSSGNRSATFRN